MVASLSLHETGQDKMGWLGLLVGTSLWVLVLIGGWRFWCQLLCA